MYFINMLLAFCVLTGIVLLFCSIMQINLGEGMLLSASAIVLLFYLGSLLGSFQYGFYGIIAASVLGWLLWLLCFFKNRKKACHVFASPAYWALLAVFCASLVLLYHDFIQHIDEFHHWAAAVKYMLEKDAMPTGNDFIGGGGHYGFATSLFHLFFQKMAGYNEQSMYVSALFFSWIGFLLPFSGDGWKNWKKILLYNGIVFVSLYSLYMYGTKSLYVDVATAAWAGGLAGWYFRRDRTKKKADWLILAAGLIMLHFMKESAGFLMAVLVLCFIAAQRWIIETGYIRKEKGVRNICILTGVLLALLVVCCLLLRFFISHIQPLQTGDTAVAFTFAGIRLPQRLADMVDAFKVTDQKAQKTLSSFITKLFGTELASRSNLDLTFLPFVMGILMLYKVLGDLYRRKKEYMVYILYASVATAVFSVAVYFSYVFMFAYELSIKLRSVGRYFSIMGIYLFVILLVLLLQEENAKTERKQEYLAYGILFFFLLGLNSKFIPNATAIDKNSISGASKIRATAKQISQIESLISEEDKVYLICQYAQDSLGDAELITAPASYYMGDQVSNYLRLPWNFYSDGSNVRLENSALSIEDLPALLEKNGYTYLWVYSSNDYLEKNLPEVLECQKVDDGYLYQIIYEDGKAVGADLVAKLK